MMPSAGTTVATSGYLLTLRSIGRTATIFLAMPIIMDLRNTGILYHFSWVGNFVIAKSTMKLAPHKITRHMVCIYIVRI